MDGRVKENEKDEEGKIEKDEEEFQHARKKKF